MRAASTALLLLSLSLSRREAGEVCVVLGELARARSKLKSRGGARPEWLTVSLEIDKRERGHNTESVKNAQKRLEQATEG